MTKQIMIAIHPEHAVKILNLIKEYEVRTWQIPSGTVVNIYVSKGKQGLYFDYLKKEFFLFGKGVHNGLILNGKVVARFTVGEVQKISHTPYYLDLLSDKLTNRYFEFSNYYNEKASLTLDELEDYGKGNDLYFHQITNLEIFDTPKELSEFYKQEAKECQYSPFNYDNDYETCLNTYKLKKAPQKFAWVYGKE